MAIAADRPPSLTEAAVDTLRERILDLTLKPGSGVDERLLMERFELSRTPAREALNRLVAEGLVEIRRNRGAFVRPLDIGQLREFFDAYIASERLNGLLCRMDQSGLEADLRHSADAFVDVARDLRFLEMTSANAAFHLCIADATDNEHVRGFSRRLHNLARRLSYFTYRSEHHEDGGMVAHQEKIRDDHEAIIDAVRRQDRDDLVESLTRHAMLFHARAFGVLGKTRANDFVMPTALSDDRVSND